jgi:hypothetical protein
MRREVGEGQGKALFHATFRSPSTVINSLGPDIGLSVVERIAPAARSCFRWQGLVALPVRASGAILFERKRRLKLKHFVCHEGDRRNDLIHDYLLERALRSAESIERLKDDDGASHSTAVHDLAWTSVLSDGAYSLRY